MKFPTPKQMGEILEEIFKSQAGDVAAKKNQANILRDDIDKTQFDLLRLFLAVRKLYPDCDMFKKLMPKTK